MDGVLRTMEILKCEQAIPDVSVPLLGLGCVSATMLVCI